MSTPWPILSIRKLATSAVSCWRTMPTTCAGLCRSRPAFSSNSYTHMAYPYPYSSQAEDSSAAEQAMSVQECCDHPLTKGPAMHE